MRLAAVSLLAIASLHAPATFAGESAGPTAKPKGGAVKSKDDQGSDDQAAAPAKAAKPKGVPKDPENVKGISPYEEIIARGKARAGEKDWAAAAMAFQEAIDLNPDEARGYLLLAQAKRDGDVMDVVEKGRSKKGSEQTEAKLMFVRAELLERKASVTPTTATGNELASMLKSVWEQSVDAWGSYASYVSSHPRVPDHKATAEARRKAIEERGEREQKFATVRAKRENK
jgi:hypothetical protein